MSKKNERWSLEPWSGLPSRDIVDENGERVARVPCGPDGREITGNGRLVLAAPALYAVLRQTIEDVDALRGYYANPKRARVTMLRIIDRAEKALAAADEGSTNPARECDSHVVIAALALAEFVDRMEREVGMCGNFSEISDSFTLEAYRAAIARARGES